MVAFLVLILVAVVVGVVPFAAYHAVRAGMRSVGDRREVGVDDAMEIRLVRIEEAIDAMAAQIEQLAVQQRQALLPGSRGPVEEPDELRASRRTE
jgi:hypothetical protein